MPKESIGGRAGLRYHARVILPIDDTPDSPPPADLTPQVVRFFGPGGALEKACAGEDYAYEHRPQQQRMAEEVARAIRDNAHLAIEAGTGVGKSYAYLVPLILHAVATGRKAVVATHTISLQEQLIKKDIPFLRGHMGVEFKAVLVKGKSNYLCLRRLDRSRRMGGELFAPGERAWIDRIRDWAKSAEDGSIQEMDDQPPPDVWSSVCVEEGNCLHRKCPEFRECFFFKARERARNADLLVANHHLLFVDLDLRRQAISILPEYTVLVLDEAHAVEEVAGEHFGLRLSEAMLDHWMRRLHRPERNLGLLSLTRDGDGIRLLDEIFDEGSRFFGALGAWADFTKDRRERIVPGPLPIDTALPARIQRLVLHLRERQETEESKEIQAEMRQAIKKGQALREALVDFLDRRREGQVYWLACEGRRNQTVLYTAPIEVGPLLKEHLFREIPSVIMTSATLSVAGSLDYFLGRVGAREQARTEQVGSPFDYARQMRIVVPRCMPVPGHPDFEAALARNITALARRHPGGCMALFTNAGLMRRVAERSQAGLAGAGRRLLVQGRELSRHTMLETLRADPGVVLFGLDSFWTGVDVRGDALRTVIITRLPFAVPDHPLVKARMDRIEEQGGDSFKEFSLPEAVIQFRQGVGRLIRTTTDTGVVAVLDRRVVEKWYGRWFLRSVPECPVEIMDLEGGLEEIGD